MNFNRIQKYRSEKALIQASNIKSNHHMPSKDAAPQTNNNSQNHKVESPIKKLQSTPISQSSYIHAKGITLRDYLYLTSTTSRKSSSVEKNNKTSIKQKEQNSKDNQLNHRRSTSQIRKEKYQASNAQIFEIVRQDIIMDLGGLEQIVEQLQQNFNRNVQYQYLDSTKIIEVYNFRKVLRQNVISQIKKLNDMIIAIRKDQTNGEDHLQMPIIIENEEELKNQYPKLLQSNITFCGEKKSQIMNRSYSLKKY